MPIYKALIEVVFKAPSMKEAKDELIFKMDAGEIAIGHDSIKSLQLEGEKSVSVNQIPISKRSIMKTTYEDTLKHFQNGLSVQQIGAIRKLKETTIQSHLMELYKNQYIDNIDFLIKKENEKLILNVIRKYGIQKLKEIKVRLPENISYTEIKAVAIKNNML